MFTSQRSPQEKNPSDFHNFQLFMCLTCWGGHILNFVFQISLCWFDTWKLVYSSSRGILLNLQNPPNSEITMECFGIFAYENSCLLFFCWSTNGFISFTYPFKLHSVMEVRAFLILTDLTLNKRNTMFILNYSFFFTVTKTQNSHSVLFHFYNLWNSPAGFEITSHLLLSHCVQYSICCLLLQWISAGVEWRISTLNCLSWWTNS